MFTVDNENVLFSNSVSNRTKLAYFGGVCLLLFFSGVLIGFVPIKHAIVQSELYTTLEVDLGMVISLTSMSLFTFPIGWMVDKYGHKTMAFVGAIIQLVGHVMIAFCFLFDLPAWVFIVSVTLDAVANPLLFTSVMQFAKLFDQWEDLFLSILTATWDLSAFLGFMVLWLYNFGFPLSGVFWISSAIYFVSILVIWKCFPPQKIQRSPTETDQEQLLDQTGSLKHLQRNQGFCYCWRADVFPTAFLVITIVAATFNIVSTNFYLINFNDLLLVAKDDDDDDDAREILITLFSLCFPVLGFISAIVAGTVTQTRGLRISVAIMVLLQILFVVATNIPHPIVQGVAILFYTVQRMVLYTSINVCVTTLLPRENIGRNIGLVYGISSCCNLVNYGFSYLGDVVGYQWIQVALNSMAILSSIVWALFL